MFQRSVSGEPIDRPTDPRSTDRASLLENLKRRHEANEALRRGVCLLNTGRFDLAEKAFRRTDELGCTDRSLPSYLAACLLGRDRPEEAVDALQTGVDAADDCVTPRIRYALALAAAGRPEDAIAALRDALRVRPETAELHFQLGTLLASRSELEEAELRFAQAVNIDRDHVEAMISLGACCGARNAPDEALANLQRAQARQPHNARVGLMLTLAAKAVQHQGRSVRVRADMPTAERFDDRRGIEELSCVIAREPDFVDAFLSISVGEVDEEVFAVLLRTIRVALERQPEHAELHYHCGRVLSRLGREEDAIAHNEQAVEIDPTFVRALIELGKLYGRTDRHADAATRLEQAVNAGADYADVHYLLGNLYRDQGQLTRARDAYRRALALNEKFRDAQLALDALPA